MNKKNIENIYPLSPIQQGMLFHTLSAPESGVYFVQSCYTFTTTIDIPAFKQAWQQIINQHPILRTSFYWKQHKEPFQVVHRYVELPWQEYNWQSLSVVEQQESLEVFLQADRQKGFDISQPPLMRLILIQVAQETYHFIWSSHHLLLDGWSTALVLQQVFQTYESLCQGQVLPLPRSRPYADYIAWLQQQNLDQAEAFWRKVLKGFTAPTQLRIGSLSNSATGSGEESIKLSPVTTVALQTLARQHKLTLNTVVQGAWAILLSCYSGEEDVVFGATSAGRPPALAGSESMVGLFINTLPVRVQVSGNELLIPWLQKLQAQQLETQQYEYSPLVQVQGWSEVRNLPLFESIFVFENYPVDASLKEWATEMQIHNIRSIESTNYPITFSVGVSTELSLKILYDCSRFDVATIRAILVHLKTLLEGIVVNPSRSLCSLPLLTKTEQNQLLEWNTITTEYPQDKCIHQLFEEQVEKTPDAVAVVFEEQHLTYRELNQRANQLAHYLQKLGVESDALVGICVERSLEMVIGILGILKAGGAYIPLDPSYPQQRLAFMLENSQIQVLLSQQNLVAQLGDYAAKVICLDTDWENIAQESQENPLTDVSNHNLAYVIYTSGSTGIPKGVLIQHSNVVRLLAATQAWFEFNSNDVWTLFHSYAFDFSVWEIWGALLYGGRLVVVPYWVSRSPEEFYKLLSTQGVTVLNQTPSAFYQLIQADAVLQQHSLNLRFVIFGGEALVLQSLKPWFERHGDRSPQLVNMYGITETTVHVTYRRLTQEDVMQSLGSVIGRPIPDLQVYLLDQNQQLLPIGVVGEMYVGGAGIARGYLNQPELTTQRFISNPFSCKPDARLYKTGDLARYLPSGELEYIGRIDNQVKIRGFRIELGEIETAINQHPSVSTSVVVVRQDESANQIVAYITLYPEQIVTIAELRRFLESKLPNYMVPTAIVVLEALPLTPNGKIDRRALPAPNLTQLISESNFVAPATPVEEMLAGVWAKVLGLEKVGVNDNFFDLGGHSLLATRVISQIRQVFEVEIPLRRLFELPTLSELAKEIQTAINADKRLELPPIKRIERSPELPLSFAQQRLWFLSQLEPDSPFYNIPAAVRLEGQLNLAALEQSFNEILRRHEVLRTNFRTVEGQAIAVVSPTTPRLLSVIDLSELPPAQRETKVRQLALAEAQQPFNLEADTLLRVKLLRLSEQEYVTLLTMHHIVSDGWSIEVLVREVAILYQAFCEGQPSPLPELEIQYLDFTAWQKQWLEGEVLESQLAYWLKQLDGAPAVLELATDYPRPTIQSSRGAKYSFCLSPEQSLALKSLSQQQGSTLFMTLLTAFKTLLHRYTGSNDIVIGSPIANRNHSQIEGLIGFFANTLVLRTNLEGNPSFQELLHRVKEVALGAYTHQDTPFELLVEKIQPQRDLSHTPLFQVMFVLQNAQNSEVELPGLTLSTLESDSGTAKFDLTLDMRETEEGLVGTIEYSIDLFEPQTIQRMAGHLQILLCGIIANPEQQLSELPLLTADEQHQLLVGWNQTQVEYPQDQCIHQLFEAQVERTPDAVAVVFENEQLTYHQLNQRANQVAHYLQKLGVGTEVLVGICVERSLEMIIGLLGILKAGGAYLPLDPNYPQERLAFMLQDAQVKILLTQAHLLETLPPHQAKTICIDRDWQVIKNESRENINTLVSSINNAYILYTSGSTGQPKAVVIDHQNVIGLIYWAKEIFSYQDISGVLASTSICFDLSVFEIFVPLSWGGKVIVTENLLHLHSSIAAQEVTLINTVPSAIAELLRIDGIPACVRTINLAGEALPQKLVQQLYEKTSVQNVFNLYGPTEDTTYSTFSLVNAEDDLITIGRPIANTQIYILDSQLKLSPIGIPGEVYIFSTGLARGYLNRPTLTAEKFIPNPFSHKPGARLYKTGDLARYLPDGNIEFLGRIDHQVKIRGFRIELGEIEAVLSQHPAVQASVVIAEEQRIVAYWVAKQQPAPAISELRHFLGQNLPQYMIPATFVQLPALPLTPNGKVDRKALPAPDYVRPELDKQFIAPRTPIEAKLAQIWAEVLRVEQVGIEDNFFELGGDSILTIQIVAKANQAGLRLTAKQLFQYQNIAELATVCLTTDETTQAEQGIVTGLVPLTPIQQWFFRQNSPELHHYNQAVLLEIQQAIAPDVLRQSIQHLYIHHDALRLWFEQPNSGWEQVIAPPEKQVTLARFDFSTLSAAEQQPAIEAAATKLQASFDLSSGVLIQVALFDLGSHQPSRLLIIIHHLAVDGVSWRILLEDLQTVYEQLSQGKTVKLPAKTTSFKQWSYYLQKYAKSEALAQEQHYWLALSQKEIFDLPVDYLNGENTEASKDIVSIELNVEETQALLKEVPQAYNTQINDVLLTALGQTFASWTGNQSLLVELEGHGREEIFDNVDLSRTVGWFTSIFPVHINLEAALDPGTALKIVKEELRSIPNRGIGYGVLRYLSHEQQITEPLSSASKAEVLFNYLGQFDQTFSQSSSFKFAQESSGLALSQHGQRSHLLEINALITNSKLRVNWAYSKNLHRQTTLKFIAEKFKEVLCELIAHCLSPEAGGYTPSDFPDVMLDENQLEKVLAEMGLD